MQVGRCLLYFGYLVSILPTLSLISKDAATLFDQKYYPQWMSLFLNESGSSDYPMPPTSSVQDLLPAFKGISGIAIHSSPGVTVSEGQGYAMFAAGMTKNIDDLKGLVVAWQAMGQGYPDKDPVGGCGSDAGCICKKVKGTYMPAWRFPLSQCAGGCTGSAPDGDEDALMGIIYLAELANDDELRAYAVRSIVAFAMDDLGAGDKDKNSRPVPTTGDIPPSLQTMFLWRGGSCWGGYDTSSGDDNRDLCINPSYFAPGQWRLFRNYMIKYKEHVPTEFKVDDLVNVFNSSLVWGYNTLNRISCDSGLVSNWWTLPDSGWPWAGKLKCANSGTNAGDYGADACRIPWRVALDALWFPEESGQTPLYDEDGKLKGSFGGPQYANRWTTHYTQLMLSANVSCPSPDCVQFFNAVPMLKKFSSCPNCPNGFQASAWNAWGYLPPVTTFTVPVPNITKEVQQKWLDLMVSFIPKIGFPSQYYDYGQEIICTAIMGGKAWLPI